MNKSVVNGGGFSCCFPSCQKPTNQCLCITQFVVGENFPNIVGSSAIPITQSPTETDLQTIAMNVNDNRVWLTGTVGWKSLTDSPLVEFRIYRQTTVSSTLIYSGQDQISGANNQATTTFSTVDLTPGTGTISYILRATILNNATAQVIGPLTLTGMEISTSPVSI